MQKGTKVCLGRFPHHLCHPDRAEWKGPLLMLLKHQGGSSACPGAEEQLYWPKLSRTDFLNTAVVLVGHYHPSPTQAQSE